MKNLNTEQTKEMIKNLETIIVQISGSWCQPCAKLKPVMEELSKEELGVKFVYIDVNQNPELAQEYGIRGIPTVLFFKNGQKVDTFVGLLQKEEIKDFIKKNN